LLPYQCKEFFCWRRRMRAKSFLAELTCSIDEQKGDLLIFNATLWMAYLTQKQVVSAEVPLS
jgi:hypothetical protein